MTEFYVDIEHLISLVEERPALWDRTLEIYKDRTFTKSAWREICCALKDGYGRLSETEQNLIGKEIIKKWTHIRDAWMRSCRKQKEAKISGSGLSTVRKYLYHRQLQFLNKIQNEREIVTSSEPNVDRNDQFDQTDFIPEVKIEDPSSPERCTQELYVEAFPILNEEHQENHANSQVSQGECIYPIISQEPHVEKYPATSQVSETKKFSFTHSNNKKKRKLDEVELKLIQALDADTFQNRYLSFFKGTLPSIEEFQEEEAMDLQMGILELIKNIKKRRLSSVEPIQDHQQQSADTLSATISEKSNDGTEDTSKTENECAENVSFSASQTPQSSRQNRKRVATERENIFQEPVPIPEDIPSKTNNSGKVDNEYEAFGSFVAASLKNLPIDNAITAQTNIVAVLAEEKRKAVRAQTAQIHPS